MDLRIVLGCAVAGALLAGGLAAAGERDYRARAFVIRVPPDYGNEAGLRLVRSDPVLRRVLALARVGSRDPRWLRERSSVQLTSRLDFAITVETPDRLAAAALATAYAKAIRRSLRTEPGLVTRARRPRRRADARPIRLVGARSHRRALRRGGARDPQERISPRISARFSSISSRESSDSRLSRRSGSVFEGLTLKCHFS